jgi:RNA polymerase sigma factor (sigma-70 family)
MQQARQGDETAARTFCKRAKEVLRPFYNIPYFVKSLGRDEVQGVLSLTMVEFLMSYSKWPPDEEIPRLLKRISRNALLNQVHRESIRSKHRQALTSFCETGNVNEEETEAEQYIADSSEEPENKLLQMELSQTGNDAMCALRPSERKVLYGLYFEKKSAAELAREMQCTPQNVRRLHKNGLRHLRTTLSRQMETPVLAGLKEKLI